MKNSIEHKNKRLSESSKWIRLRLQIVFLLFICVVMLSACVFGVIAIALVPETVDRKMAEYHRLPKEVQNKIKFTEFMKNEKDLDKYCYLLKDI